MYIDGFPITDHVNIELFRKTDETNMELQSWHCDFHISYSEINTRCCNE